MSFLAALSIQACEPFYGVSRIAEIQDVPDLACVSASLEAVAAVTETGGGHMRESSGARSAGAETFHAYYFTVDRWPSQLVIRSVPSGQLLLIQESLSKYPVSQARVDRVRRAMSDVERQLELKCGVEGLAARVVETCINVNCDDVKSGDTE